MATRNFPSTCSTSTPEYKTFQQNIRRITLHVQEQNISIRLSLFEKGYINDSLLDVNPNGTRLENASNLVISLLRRIECDTSVFHGFVDILKSEGPSGNDITQALQQSYEFECQQQCEPDVHQQPPVVDSAYANEEIPKADEKKTSSQNISVHTKQGPEWDSYARNTNDAEEDRDVVLNVSNVPQSDTVGASLTWDTDNGKRTYGAMGNRDVLLITSNPTTQDDDVIPRRPGGELTDDDIRKLEDQGVPRDSHHDDLSIMKARYGLDKDKTIAEVLRDDGSLTCEQVTTKIAQLLKNTATSGVVLRYVGPGKKGTGDWCFSDGFISFRDIMHLYLQNEYFKGRVLTIATDCSYSGCWVKEAMVFMDEQDVGPCGHAAKEKGILVKVYASCQANEIPAELAFSTHCAKNDKNIGTVFYLSDEDIHDGQHTRRLDFTVIRCKSKIDEPCTMAPGSTWHQWSTAQRTWKVRGRGKDRGQPAWLYILLADDEDTIREFHEKEGSLDVFNYGQVLKSGFGQDPPEETHKWLKENYLINYDYQS